MVREYMICFGDLKMYYTIDGNLWEIPAFTPRPCANHLFTSVNPLPGGLDPLFPTTKELRTELLSCLMRRQILHNSIAASVPVDPMILTGLTLGDSPNFVAIPHRGKVYAAQCSPINYQDLRWLTHDVWIPVANGAVLGCLDARLSAIFSDCIRYNDTLVWEVDRQWKVRFDNGTYSATPNSGSYQAQIGVIESVITEFSEYLDDMINPPLYPPAGGGDNTVIPVPGSGETVASPFDWFKNLSLVAKIGSIAGMVLGVVVLVAGAILVIKCLR